MNGWPPQPGLTVMHSARSRSAATSASTRTGVAGQIATPARAARLLDRADRVVHVRRRLGVERDVVGAGLGELARSGARGARSSGGRRSARPRRGRGRRARRPTSGPIVIGGTKWPSMTSTWMTRAPASSTSPTCSPRRAKSAARIEGAMPVELGHDGLEHRAAAVVARCTARCRTCARSWSARRSSGQTELSSKRVRQFTQR